MAIHLDISWPSWTIISRRRLLWLGGAGLAATVAPIALPPTTSAAPAAHEILCRDAWGAARCPPRGQAAHPQPHDDPPHRRGARRQRQRACPTAPAPALPPRHAGVDRHRISLQCRPPREHLPAAQPRLGRRHRDELRPDRSLSCRLAREISTKKKYQKTNSMALPLYSPGPQTNSVSQPGPLRDTATSVQIRSCPGASLYEHVTSGDLQSRVDVCWQPAQWISRRAAGQRRQRSSPKSKRVSATATGDRRPRRYRRRLGRPPALCVSHR